MRTPLALCAGFLGALALFASAGFQAPGGQAWPPPSSALVHLVFQDAVNSAEQTLFDVPPDAFLVLTGIGRHRGMSQFELVERRGGVDKLLWWSSVAMQDDLSTEGALTWTAPVGSGVPLRPGSQLVIKNLSTGGGALDMRRFRLTGYLTR